MRAPSLPYALLLFLSTALSGVATAQSGQAEGDARATLPSPEQHLGQQVGADGFLADYEQLVDYWATLAAQSPRMVVEEIGQTSYGQSMVMAVITSPNNHKRLERLREISGTMGRGRIGEDEAQALSREGCAVVWIDAGLHANEAVAGQNLLELVWRMVSHDDPETRAILDNVVLLACPVNPDGMQMMSHAYRATGKLQLPVLYQRYVGHDNNRDFYASNMVETRNVNRVFYERWYPQIVYNHHQTAPRGTILFTPPFRDPFNYNVDPMVVRGIDVVSAQMNQRFALEGKPGVISRTGASYSTWWNGGLRTTTYFHNMIGILTEAFGRPDPTPLRQSLDRRLPYSDYPQPIESQELWHARQTIEYLMTANYAILTYAARYPQDLLFGFWRMGRNSIERGSRDHWTVTPPLVARARKVADEAKDGSADRTSVAGVADEVFKQSELRDPRAWIVPLVAAQSGDEAVATQGDPGAAIRFVQTLQRGGLEVHRVRESFTWQNQTIAAGSLVVRADQAFRPHAMDMFEPQWHPDDLGTGGQPVRPYDAAGWTLAYQMGVDVLRVLDGFTDEVESVLEPVNGIVAPTATNILGDGDAGFWLDGRDQNAYPTVARLLGVGVKVQFVRNGSSDRVFVESSSNAEGVLSICTNDFGITVHRAAKPPAEDVAATRSTAPRVGIYEPWGGNMPTGHARWVFEQFEIQHAPVFGQRLLEGDLRADFDVLVFCTGLPVGRTVRRRTEMTDEDLQALQAALPPFEDWSTLSERAQRPSRDVVLPALREFVEAGGTLIAVGAEAGKAARGFDLPVRLGPTRPESSSGDSSTEGGEEAGDRERVSSKDFFIPGSLLQTTLAADEPLAFGLAATLDVMFRRGNPVLEIEPGAADVRVVARYAEADALRSGWAIGQEFVFGQAAVAEATVGSGRVVLCAPDVLYRGQSHASFKLVFNAILRSQPAK